MYDWFMWYIGWLSLGVIFMVTGTFVTFAMLLPIAGLVHMFNLLRGSRLFRGWFSTSRPSTE